MRRLRFWIMSLICIPYSSFEFARFIPTILCKLLLCVLCLWRRAFQITFFQWIFNSLIFSISIPIFAIFNMQKFYSLKRLCRHTLIDRNIYSFIPLENYLACISGFYKGEEQLRFFAHFAHLHDWLSLLIKVELCGSAPLDFQHSIITFLCNRSCVIQ